MRMGYHARGFRVFVVYKLWCTKQQSSYNAIASIHPTSRSRPRHARFGAGPAEGSDTYGQVRRRHSGHWGCPTAPQERRHKLHLALGGLLHIGMKTT